MIADQTCGRCAHSTPVLHEKGGADTGFVRCALLAKPWLWHSRVLACDYTPPRFEQREQQP